MCTIAWGTNGGALWVCFNRDEQRSRPAAELPAIHESYGNRRVYARDPQAGGTWFAASEAGFVTALLNHYPSGGGPSIPGKRSRGQVVLELAGCASLKEAAAALEDMSLMDFSPFSVFLLAPGDAGQWVWNGQGLAKADAAPFMWTTSSYKPDPVSKWRMEQWQRETGGQDPSMEIARSILRQRAPDPAFGFTMDRDDARTVSRIELVLDAGSLHFSYFRRQPAGLEFADPRVIDLEWGSA